MMMCPLTCPWYCTFLAPGVRHGTRVRELTHARCDAMHVTTM
jgi:hypothetical protein